MHRLAEWKLAELDREKAELAAGQEQLVGALNDDSALQGLFVEAMARRLSGAGPRDRPGRTRRARPEPPADRGGPDAEADRAHDRPAAPRASNELGKRGFAELLDMLAGRDDASLP